MNNRRSGFMLLEAILSVVIVSICLTLIAQSLLTNFRTGVRFQEMTRSLIVMENRLGLLFATDASQVDFNSNVTPMSTPFDKFTSSAATSAVNDHLKKVELQLNWPAGHAQGHLEVTTFVNIPDET